MLRTRTLRTTGGTNINFTVTHGLGAVPEFWALECVSGRGMGRTFVVPGTVNTISLQLRNSLMSTVTIDVFCVNYAGRLY
jgi:hypothetical protein